MADETTTESTESEEANDERGAGALDHVGEEPHFDPAEAFLGRKSAPKPEAEEETAEAEAEEQPEAEAKPAKGKDKAKKKDDEEDEEKDEPARAFIALKKQRKELRQREGRLEGRERQLAEAQQQYAAQVEQLRAERDKLQTLAQEDPIAALRAQGIEPRDLIKRIAGEDDSPTTKELRELKKQLAEQREEFERKLMEKEQAREQTQAQAAAIHQVDTTIKQIIETSDGMPLLALESPDDIRAAVADVYSREYAPLGLPFEEEELTEVLEAFEERLRAQFEERQSRIAQRTGGAKKAPPARRNGAVQSAETGTHSESMSNAEAAERTGRQRPRTIEEKMEDAIRLYARN